jgi:O-antigen/teichoic acid export membrane protein
MIMGGANMALRIVSFFSAIILARLLDPSDFGLVTLAYIVLSTTGLFAGLGLGPALIQFPGGRGHASYQAFVVVMGTGMILFVLVEAFSSLLAEALGHPEIVTILRWLSLLILTSSCTAVPEALLHKELRFNVISTSVIIAELFYSVLAVTLAVLGTGVWSLVYAALGKQFVYATLVWSRTRGWDWLRPRPWDSALMKRLLSFGWQSAGSGLVVYAYQTVDNLAVGRFLGASALGFYGKAYDFTFRTVFGLSAVLGSVLFPSYAKIQSDPDRLSRAYLKSLRVVSLFTVPLSMGIFILAEQAVTVLLGDNWLPMVPAFRVLSFVGFVMPISASTAAVFASTGRPGYNLRAGLVVLGVMIPLILLLLPMGIVGVALAVLAAHVSGFGFNMYQVSRVVRNTVSKMLPAVAPATVGAAIMMAGVQFSRSFVVTVTGGNHSLVSLVLSIMVGVLIYGTWIFVSQRSLVFELLGMFRRTRAPAQKEIPPGADDRL